MSNTLNFCGTEYPFRLTMGAMLRFKRQTGKEVGEIANGDLESIIALVWCCVVAACHADGVEFSVDFETFADKLTPDEFANATSMLFEPQKKSE